MPYLRMSVMLRGDLVTVFFVGLVLGTARSLSGSLYLCVGLHSVCNIVVLIGGALVPTQRTIITAPRQKKTRLKGMEGRVKGGEVSVCTRRSVLPLKMPNLTVDYEVPEEFGHLSVSWCIVKHRLDNSDPDRPETSDIY